MRKRFGSGWIAGSWTVAGLLACVAVPSLRADIVKKVVVEDGQVVSGYVLQGSRNGVKTSRSRTVVRKITPYFRVDSAVTPATVLPPLETEEVKKAEAPRPRFGYGSGYQSDPVEVPEYEKENPNRNGKTTPYKGSVVVPQASLTPVYQFYTEYPKVEYWPAVPYFYGGSSCGHHTSYSSLGYQWYGHSSTSRFRASIATPFFSLHWHR